MLKTFLKDSAVYGSATVISRGIQILLVPIYTRVLAPADYGVLDLMMVVAAFAHPLLTLQITTGMGRSLADAEADEQRTRIVSTAMWFTLAATAIVVAVALGIPGFAGRAIGIDGGLFRAGLLVIAMQFVFSGLLDVTRWELRPVIYAVSTVAYTVVAAGVAVALVVWKRTGVIGVFYGQLAAYSLAIALVVATAARRRLRAHFDRAKFREMLTFSGPLVFSSLFFAVGSFTDRIGINAVLGRDDLGIYGIGSRVATTVALVIAAFAYALEPLVLTRFREPETPAQVARLLRVFLVLILPLVLGLALFAGEMMRIIVPPEYYGSAQVIAPLAASTVLAGMTMFTPGLTVARKTRLIALVVIATSALSVLLNFLLIPRFGVRGAAAASVLGAAIVFGVNLAASQRHYPIPHSGWRLGAAGAITALGIAVGHAMSSTDLDVGVLALKAAMWIGGCGCLALALLDATDLRIVRDRLRGALHSS